MLPSNTRRPLLLLAALLLPTAVAAATATPRLDTAALGALAARAIGPSTMSGRLTAVEVAASDPKTIWVGAAAGGVWKSTNAGVSWKPVFDKAMVASVGAIGLDPTRPTHAFVGTGESCTRNSVSFGEGIFRTTDGGDSWERVGLEKTERIAKVVVDPNKPDTVFAAAPGALWGPSPDRGLYRTTDAGATWTKVLFVDDATGVSDVALDPAEPSIVYAASWQFRRTAWSFVSGGPGSALWKSTDGGTTWRRLAKGLPGGPLGRCALAVAPSRPGTVYATVEAKDGGGLYRSDDAGESWRLMNSGAMLTARPFYFSHLVVDPKDHRRVWKPGFVLSGSVDGGASFAPSPGSYHADVHALWVDPADGEHLLMGTDGGLYESPDRGGSWRHFKNLPVSQFYRVAVDDGRPYSVSGGLQDNGAWRGPSRRSGGIRPGDWSSLGIGDGFATFSLPGNPDVVFTEYQGGHLLRRHLDTGEMKEIRPFAPAGAPKYRFNWNTPLLPDPHDPKVLWTGAQQLLRSTDAGDRWVAVSPDLTTNDPAKQRQEESGGLTIDNSDAENHCTITAIAVSPLDPAEIWVGTDDGRLQVTRDGGTRWTDLSASLPLRAWVTSIEPSRHDRRTLFVTLDAHATGDLRPHLLRSTDAGATWTAIAVANFPLGWAHVVREDPVRPGLLYFGTEAGLFVSIDAGEVWARFGPTLPPAPVRDVVVHPRDGDLVVATHGRGLFIVDDLSPLRALDAAALAAPATMLPSRPAVLSQPEAIQDFPGDEEYVGTTPSDAAVIHYYLRERHLLGELRLEILDPAGKVISTLSGGKRKGINRVEWAMRRKAPRVPAGAMIARQAMVGPAVPEGRYTARLVRGEETISAPFDVTADPRLPQTAAQRAEREKAVERLMALFNQLGYLDAVATRVRDDLRSRRAGASRGDTKSLERLADRFDALHRGLTAMREGGMLTGEEQIRERVSELYGGVTGWGGAPSEEQLARLAALESEVATAAKQLAALTAGELAKWNEGAGRKMPVVVPTREAWDKEAEARR